MNIPIELIQQEKSSKNVGKRTDDRPTVGYLAFLITDDLGRTWWSGIADTAWQQGANLICFRGGQLHDAMDTVTEATTIYELASAARVDGWVLGNIVADTPASLASLEGLMSQRLGPTVVGLRKSLEDIPYVSMDNYYGTYAAVAHLIQVHGYRQIAYLRGPEAHPYAQERYRAYTNALRDYGLTVNPELISPPREWYEPSIVALLEERKLKPGVDFDAVVAANDLMALDAIRRLTAQGIHIPQDVAIVGFNDNPASEVSFPPLTTVMLPFYDQGKRALEMVLTLLAGKTLSDQVTLPAQLIIRQSCGCQSPLVEAAAVVGAHVEKHPFDALDRARQDEILAQMAQTVGDHGIIAEARPILVSLISELQQNSSGKSIRELDLALEALRARGGDISVWQKALSALRRLTSPYIEGERLARFEDFWQQAQIMLNLTVQRIHAAEKIKSEKQTQSIRRMGNALVSAFNVDQIMDTLARELPSLNIPGCYVALYEDAQSPAAWSRLIMAHRESGRLQLPPGGMRFRSRELLPDELWPKNRQYCLVIEPLHYKKSQLGFIVFDTGPRDGAFYEMLGAQIGSALQGTLLVQRVQEHSAELARQKYILDTFMESVPDRIYFKDLDGRITRANKAYANWHGESNPAELTGKSDFDFYSPQDAHQRHEQERQIIQTGQPLIIEEENVRSDGEVRWGFTIKMPLRDETGNMIGIFGISRDITDLKHAQDALQKAYAEVEKQVTERTTELQQEIAARKQAEIERESLIAQMEIKNAELEARNTELERFTYTVSHDLKAPLITIRGFLGFLEKDAFSGNMERFKADSMRIVDATDKMQRLLTELLELSRIGRMMNSPQAVPFDTIVSEALELVRGRIHERQVQVVVAPQLPTLYGDHERLIEVVQNLVDNACKFMGDQPNPQIEIGQQGSEEGQPILFVRDNGIGIAPEFHERVFGLFNKLDAKTDGTGVGLTLVKRIIEVHGGRIWVESDGHHHGTTFYFSLPIKP
jgi:PAS domain S-box-containing protein